MRQIVAPELSGIFAGIGNRQQNILLAHKKSP
jgi:hypothetical protein